MLESNPGLLRLRSWHSDALTTRLDLILTRLELIHTLLAQPVGDCVCFAVAVVDVAVAISSLLCSSFGVENIHNLIVTCSKQTLKWLQQFVEEWRIFDDG
jgi:hypothetical protein